MLKMSFPHPVINGHVQQLFTECLPGKQDAVHSSDYRKALDDFLLQEDAIARRIGVGAGSGAADPQESWEAATQAPMRGKS